eukprot:4528925-Amphidinium_carterae.1
MPNVEQLALQLNQPQQELQQQHQRMQQVKAESARLRADGLGVASAHPRFGKPGTFSVQEKEWREWFVRFKSFVVGVYGEFGLAADAADQVEDVVKQAGQLYVALQQLTSKKAFDVLRPAPVGAGLEGLEVPTQI